MADQTITIHTADGAMPTHVLTPEGAGPWPTVIVYMDALAMRPALVEMAARLAGRGYRVLLPDLFYRAGAYPPFDPAEVFKGDMRAILGPLMATTGPERGTADTAALLAWLDREEPAHGKVGLVGFCMGGRMALYVAGALPDRVGAVASFHGGNLAHDAPDSPHRLAGNLRAEVYIGGADEDGSYPPEQADRLQEALAAAGVTYTHHWYPGAKHGWMMTDFPVYDRAAAERGWGEMLALFGRTLR